MSVEREESEDSLLDQLVKLQQFPVAAGTVSIADLRSAGLVVKGDDGEGWSLEEMKEKLFEWKKTYGPRLKLDPFTNRTANISIYQILKFILLLPVVILRLVLFFFCLLLCWIFSKIAIRGLKFPSNPEEVQPLPKDRREWAIQLASFNRAMIWSCGFFHLERTGERDKSVGTLVANHLSFFDPFVINSDHPIAPLNKKELSHIPFAGTILRGIQAILVDRTSKESRKATANIMKKRARENQASPDTWPPTLVFPEGTCTNGDVVMAFRPGAFLAGEAVQPVVLKYPWTYNDNHFTPAISLPRVVAFSMFQFYNRMELKYLPIYHPSEEEKADPALYAKNLQKLIADELKVPATTHSYYDMNLAEKAWCKKGFPIGSMRFEIDLLKEGLPKLTSQLADKYFDQFCEIDKNRNGKISHEELLQYYSLPSSLIFEDLFSLVSCISSDEKLEFAEFAILMYGLGHLGSDSTDKALFQQLGAGEDGLEEENFLAFMERLEDWSKTKSSVLFEKMSTKSKSVLPFAKFQEFLDNHELHRFLFLSNAEE